MVCLKQDAYVNLQAALKILDHSPFAGSFLMRVQGTWLLEIILLLLLFCRVHLLESNLESQRRLLLQTW